MPVSLSISSEFATSPANTARSQNALLKSPFSPANGSGIVQDAARVSFSSPLKAGQQNRAEALHTLSDASSFTNIAQDAASQIGSLLDRAASLSNAIAGEVDPTKKNTYATEAAAAITEITNVVSRAKLNDQTVVGRGQQTFTHNLDGSDNSSSSTFTVSVANVGLTAADLGVSNLTSSSFINDTTTTLATVKAAKQQVLQTQEHLANSETQVDSIAQSFGLVGSTRAAASSGQLKSAQSLADTIGQSLGRLVGAANTNNLSPVRVQDLIGE